jgi:GNAT superfamily N-acetyltransferase
VLTRTASLADVPSLAALWGELRQVGGRAERAVNPVAIPDIEQRLAATIQDSCCRIVLATAGGQPAGMAVLRVARPDPLSDSRVVQLVHVIVADGHRRRGVGHALVAAAVDFADDRQVEHLTAGMYPSLRDASRFYARLGFAPVLVQRVAQVAAVRRRLGADGYGRLGADGYGRLGADAYGRADAHVRADGVVRRRSRLRRSVPPQRPAAPVSQTVEGP